MRNKIRSDVQRDEEGYTNAIEDEMTLMAATNGNDYQQPPIVQSRARSEDFRLLSFPLKYLSVEELTSMTFFRVFFLEYIDKPDSKV